MITATIEKYTNILGSLYWVTLEDGVELVDRNFFEPTTPKSEMIDWATAAGAEKVTFKP